MARLGDSLFQLDLPGDNLIAARFELRGSSARAASPCREAILEMLGPLNARQRYRELLVEEIGVATQAVYGDVAAWGQTRRV